MPAGHQPLEGGQRELRGPEKDDPHGRSVHRTRGRNVQARRGLRPQPNGMNAGRAREGERTQGRNTTGAKPRTHRSCHPEERRRSDEGSPQQGEVVELRAAPAPVSHPRHPRPRHAPPATVPRRTGAHNPAAARDLGSTMDAARHLVQHESSPPEARTRPLPWWWGPSSRPVSVPPTIPHALTLDLVLDLDRHVRATPGQAPAATAAASPSLRARQSRPRGPAGPVAESPTARSAPPRRGLLRRYAPRSDGF